MREQQYIIHMVDGSTYEHWMPYTDENERGIPEWLCDESVGMDEVMTITDSMMGPLAYIPKRSISWIEVGYNRKAQ